MALIEVTGDIWSYVPTHRIVIPTNRLGVMGAGLALQAKQRYPGIQVAYQGALKTMSDKGAPWCSELFPSVICAPTKRHWRHHSIPEDVESVLLALSKLKGGPFVIPEMGCGLGGLHWNTVKPYYSVFTSVVARWVLVHPPH